MTTRANAPSITEETIREPLAAPQRAGMAAGAPPRRLARLRGDVDARPARRGVAPHRPQRPRPRRRAGGDGKRRDRQPCDAGVFAEQGLPAGVRSSPTSASAAARSTRPLVKEHLHSLVLPSEWKLGALQAALWQDGALVYVPRGVEVEVPLRYVLRAAAARRVFPHLLIVAEANSSVTVVQDVASADAAAGSRCSAAPSRSSPGRTRACASSRSAALGQRSVYSFSTIRARLDRGAELSASLIGLGGRLTTHEARSQRSSAKARAPSSSASASATASSTSTTRRCRTTSRRAPPATCCSRRRWTASRARSGTAPSASSKGAEPERGQPDQPQPAAQRPRQGGADPGARDRGLRRAALQPRRHRRPPRRGAALLPRVARHPAGRGGEPAGRGLLPRGRSTACRARRSRERVADRRSRPRSERSELDGVRQRSARKSDVAGRRGARLRGRRPQHRARQRRRRQFYAIDNLCTHDNGPLGEGTLWRRPRSSARATAPASTSRPAPSRRCPPCVPCAPTRSQVDGDDILWMS